MSTPRLYARRNETRTQIGPGLVKVEYEMWIPSRGGWTRVTGEERDVALAGESPMLRGARAYAAMTPQQRDDYETALRAAAGCFRPTREFPIGSRFD